MATYGQIIDALVRAAERIAGRALSDDEKTRLRGYYNSAKSVSEPAKSLEALKRFFGWSEYDLVQFRSSSENNQRLIGDLERDVTKK